MKKVSILFLVPVLACCILAGCRDRNQPMETTRPDTAPTVAPTVMPTVIPETEQTRPTTANTQPTETVDNGNGPMNGTDSGEETGIPVGTESTGPESRSGGVMNGRK